MITRLFGQKATECPRCLGKGHVDEADIKRLKKELIWLPGACAYCDGKGEVSKRQIRTLDAGTEYLSIDLSPEERQQVLKGDPGALKRAEEFEAYMADLINAIRFLHDSERKDAQEIADYLLSEHEQTESLELEKQDLIKYIQKVIDHTV